MALNKCVKSLLCLGLLVMAGITLQGCNSTQPTQSDVVNPISPYNKKGVDDGSETSSATTTIVNTSSTHTQNHQQQAKQSIQRIALMPFTSLDNSSDEIVTMLRESVFSHLSSTNYMFVRPQAVDQRLLLLDEQDFDAKDAQLLSGMLEADAILFGQILSSDVTYVGVAAQIYYKVEMRLIDKNGNLVWSDIFSERSLQGGMSADPFSLLYSLAVTAMHVGKENMFAVADKIGRQVATSIPQPEGVFTLRNLFIESVIHDGANKALKYGDTVKVGIKAPANLNVDVAIESVAELFSAKEGEPGTYFVDIPVNSKWNGKNLLLTAYVTDKLGNRARKISTLGLLEFDNQAPIKVADLRADLQNDTVSLRWTAPEYGLSYTVYEIQNNTQILLQTSSQNNITVPRSHEAFNTYTYAVEATDKAGNTSQLAQINSEFLPFNAQKQAAVLTKAKLPGVINVDTRLSKQHSPYLVDTTSTVTNNAILFIDPGVVLEFSQSGTLEIQGSLSTFGQAPVMLKSINEQLSDQTFLRINSERHVELNGFNIQNAGIAVEVLKGKPRFKSGSVLNSKYSAFSIVNTANVSIDNCVINGSNTSAVVVANNARLSIKNSQLLNNLPFHIQNSSTYQVDARTNQWQPAADVMTVLGNVKY